MAQVIITGEPAGTWDDAVNVSGQTYTYEVDVTGITDMETLQAYMKDQGCMPYAVLPGGDGFGQGVIYLKTKYDNTNASDPTEQDVPVVSGTLSLGGLLTLDPIVGGLDLSSYTLEGFYAKLAEDYVVNAILRAMFLQFEASEIPQQFKEAVMGSLHAYADAKSQVPVYVDKHGQAYVFADMVETVREQLVDLSAYFSGTVFPQYQTSGEITITSLSSGRDLLDYALSNLVNCYYTIPDNYMQNLYNFIDAHAGHPIVITIYDTPSSYEGSSPLTIRAYDGLSVNSTYTLGSSTLTEYYITTNGKKTTDEMKIRSTSTSSLNRQRISFIGEVFENNDHKYCNINATTSAGVDGVTVASNVPANFADLSYGLDGVLPDWWQKRKALAVPRAKHQAQADDDIYAKSPALPLDIPTDMVLDDGYAGDSDLVTEGDIADELKDIIMDVLPTIIDEIIDYAQDPTIPDIPVSDHGDTPPEDPTLLSGASNGLWTIYNPTLAQVNSFGAWLWSSSILDQITRMFNSPIDAVIGFHMIYCTPTTGASKHIKAGFLDSEVSAAEVTNQYVEINCGQVAVTEFYNNVLDYTNTRISIFLPFCGFFPLDTAVVMGSTLEVTYRVDVLTGTCLAQVKVIKQNSAAVMYSFAGNCAVQVPLTATTYTGMVGALVSTLSAGASLMTGNMIGAGASAMRAMTAGMTGLSGVRQSGSMGANAGALGIRTPYLVITHPTQANAYDFGAVSGLPANKTVRLGDVSGFTRVYATHLDAISGATSDEIEQIREMLSNGVIL